MPRKKKGQRADGLYQCKRKMPDGKYKVFYGKTKTEAENKYKNALMQFEKKKSDAEKFENAAEEYWESLLKRIKNKTDSTYRSNYQRCVEEFSGYRMDEITKRMVENFQEKLADEGLSASTIRNTRSVLSGIFRKWRLKTNSSYNPLQDTATGVGKQAVEREPPTEKELAAFRAHPEGFGICAWIFMYTGCRLGEAVALRWRDIDFDENTVHVRMSASWAGGGIDVRAPKTKNGVRTVPLMPQLKKVLEPRRGDPDEFVIGGKTRPLTDAEYHDAWLQYCTELGLVVPSEGRTRYRDKRRSAKSKEELAPVMKASVTAHQFRHSYATDLYDAGVGVLEAKRLMGHANISTTYKVYTHIRERKLQEATQKLESFYAEKETKEEK